MKIMDYKNMTAKITEAEVNQFKFTVGILGTTISVLGYCLMITTAALFPAWRRNPQNQLWLHMCGSYLIYFCSDFYTFLFPIEDFFVSATVDHIKRYIVRVSLCWMLTGAYLTYKNLVDVFNSIGDNFMLKATLLMWLGPIPIEVAKYVIYYYQFMEQNYATGVKVPVGCNLFAKEEARNVFWHITCLLDNFLLVVPIFGSFGYYIRVAWAIFMSRNALGQKRDLASTVILGFFFVFTCCLQCVIITAKFIFQLQGIWNYATIFLMSFHVSTYSILFIVCNKMTRVMWLKFLKTKLLGSKSSFTQSTKV